MSSIGLYNGKYLEEMAIAANVAATITNRSGTIATGGTAQQLMEANAGRGGWSIQNQSGADLWVNPFETATIGTGVKVLAGALYEAPQNAQGVGAISIIGATTGQAFYAMEW